jgi:hypothetical protein
MGPISTLALLIIFPFKVPSILTSPLVSILPDIDVPLPIIVLEILPASGWVVFDLELNRDFNFSGETGFSTSITPLNLKYS